MDISPFDLGDLGDWRRSGASLAELVTVPKRKKGKTQALRLLQAAREVLPPLAALRLPNKFGAPGWADFHDVIREMTTIAIAMREESAAAAAALLMKKGIIGERHQVEKQLFFAADVLKEAIFLIRLKSRRAYGNTVHRWSQITFCTFCGRLVAAATTRDPVCSHHTSSRNKTVRVTFSEFEKLRKRLFLELSDLIRPSHDDYGNLVAMMGDIGVQPCQSTRQLPHPSITTVLSHFPCISKKLDLAQIDLSDTHSVLNMIDPVGADTYGQQRRAHEMIAKNPSLACVMLCRAEAREIMSTTLKKQRGGKRKGAGRKSTEQVTLSDVPLMKG